MKKILLEDALILSAIKIARFLVRFLPLGAALSLGRGLGNFAYAVSKRRGIAYRNLRAVFAAEKPRAELKRIARASFQNVATSAIELLRAPEMDKNFVEKYVRIEGEEKLKSLRTDKQGLIFLTAHFGNWEMLNIVSGIKDYRLVALARHQKHPRSDAYLNSLRTCKGSQVIIKGIAVREILRALRSGHIVGILSDQDGGKKGTFVNFFGRQSSYPSGVATFAVRTGSPIVPVFDFRESPYGHRIEVCDALRFPDASLSDEEQEQFILQQFASVLEEKIRRKPEQWLWAHRRWKSTPNRSVLVLSDGKAGHLHQSLAAAEAIRQERAAQGCDPASLRLKTVEVFYRNSFLKLIFSLAGFLTAGHIPFKHFWLKTVLKPETYKEIMATYADIVISSGSSVSGINLLVKNENLARSLVVMRPPFGLGLFDAVIMPRHDRPKEASNVFVTEGVLSNSQPRKAEDWAKIFKDELKFGPGKKIGLLIGGNTRDMVFEPEHFNGMIAAVEKFSRDNRCQLLATSSRRTPAWADETLKNKLKEKSLCPLLVIANEANRPGVVDAILGLSDAVIVTAESLSMVSEAVLSGKPVFVFVPAGKTQLKAKHQRFVDGMSQLQLVSAVNAENVGEMLSRALSGAGRDPQKAGTLQKDGTVLAMAARLVST